MNAIDLDVQGMTCGACVQRVTAALARIEGVYDVAVDLRSGRVRVTAEASVAPSQLISALAARRYESVVVTNGAPPGQATYSPLPPAAPKGGCCCS
jgi:copper chaperone